MDENNVLNFKDAASIIKEAIVRSRYQAATLVNKELLSLYYAVGKYVSDNSREGYWGKGAIKQISETLQKEIPGIRGFSEGAIKKMRLFFEGWLPVFSNRPLLMGDLKNISNRQSSIGELQNSPNRSLTMNDLKIAQISKKKQNFIDLTLLARHLSVFAETGFSTDAFLKVGFTHHSEIPEQWQKALPDLEDMKKLLDSVTDELDSKADK